MADPRILEAIPHRPPFLLIDEIVDWQDAAITCRRTLAAEDFWFAGHYPQQPILPGVLQCEACLQAGAVLLSRHVSPEAGHVPVATRMNNVKFKRIVQPGEVIEVAVTLDERLADAFYLTGKVTVGGKLTTRLEFAVTVTTLDAHG